MEIATKIAPIALAIIMLGLGTSLRLNDFLRVAKFPKDFLIGLVCQLFVLPIIAFLLIMIMDLPIEIAVGVMLIAAAPGGVTSNVLTKFCNGDVALSISLTAIISLISILSVPIIIFSSMKSLGVNIEENNISMIQVSLKMFFVVMVPVIIGMLIRFFAEEKIIKYELIITRTSIILFIIVFLAIWIEEWENIEEYLKLSGTVALSLNIIMMIIGFYISKIFTSDIPQQKTISLECGLQNGTLAVVVGTQLFDEVIYLMPTAAYALIMLPTAIIFVLILKKQ